MFIGFVYLFAFLLFFFALLSMVLAFSFTFTLHHHFEMAGACFNLAKKTPRLLGPLFASQLYYEEIAGVCLGGLVCCAPNVHWSPYWSHLRQASVGVPLKPISFVQCNIAFASVLSSVVNHVDFVQRASAGTRALHSSKRTHWGQQGAARQAWEWWRRLWWDARCQ